MNGKLVHSLGFCTALLFSLNAPAHEDHHHHHDSLGAHVHGKGQLELAVEGRQAELVFSAPGMDIVGFEHKPRDEQQRQAVREAVSYLEETPLIRAAQAQCSLLESNVESSLIDAAGDHHHHDGEGHHHHNDDHSSHAEFTVTQMLECQPGLSGLRIEAGLLAQYPDLEELRVTWISDGGQGSARLAPGNRYFTLQ